MATSWERAAYSVDHMFSLYFDYLLLELFPVFGFEGGIWVLISPVPGHFIHVIFGNTMIKVERF